MSETLQMYAALRLSGVDAHLLRFPGATHSSSAMRPSLFAAEIATTISWFEKQRGARDRAADVRVHQQGAEELAQASK